MKRMYFKLSAIAIAAMLLVPASIRAQEEKERVKNDKKDKELETIVITKKTDSKEKIVVEINGDKITVNGKPIEDLKDGDISVNRHKMRTFNSMNAFNGQNQWNYNADANGMLFNE